MEHRSPNAADSFSSDAAVPAVPEQGMHRKAADGSPLSPGAKSWETPAVRNGTDVPMGPEWKKNVS